MTSSPAISLAFLSTRQERSNFEPRRATGYRRGTTSTLWLNTSGRSAITLASGISSPRKSGVRTSTLQFGAWRRIWRITPTNARRAEVREVVAVDARDHRVPEAHLRDRSRHPGRLERVVPRRLARLDVAEAAAPGAGVAEDHERGGAALPALADVRARRLLADRVEVLGLDQVLQLAVPRAARRRHLEPRRLAGAERLHVRPEDLEDVRVATGVGARPRRHTTKARGSRCAGLATPRRTHVTIFRARSLHVRGPGRETTTERRFSTRPWWSLRPAATARRVRPGSAPRLGLTARAVQQRAAAGRLHRIHHASTRWCPGSCSSARASGWRPCSPAARARSSPTAPRRRCTSSGDLAATKIDVTVPGRSAAQARRHRGPPFDHAHRQGRHGRQQHPVHHRRPHPPRPRRGRHRCASSSAPSTRPRSPRCSISRPSRTSSPATPPAQAPKPSATSSTTHYIGRTPTGSENEEALLAITRAARHPRPGVQRRSSSSTTAARRSARTSSGVSSASSSRPTAASGTRAASGSSPTAARPAADRRRVDDHPHHLEADDPTAA